MSMQADADAELARLRAELIQFVLSQVEARVAGDPQAPLSRALATQVVQAVDQRLKASAFDAADIADHVLSQLRPNLEALLIQGRGDGGYGAVQGHQGPGGLDATPARRQIVDMLIGAAAAVTLLALGLAGGFVLGSGQLVGKPDASSAVSVEDDAGASVAPLEPTAPVSETPQKTAPAARR